MVCEVDFAGLENGAPEEAEGLAWESIYGCRWGMSLGDVAGGCRWGMPLRDAAGGCSSEVTVVGRRGEVCVGREGAG